MAGLNVTGPALLLWVPVPEVTILPTRVPSMWVLVVTVVLRIPPALFCVTLPSSMAGPARVLTVKFRLRLLPLLLKLLSASESELNNTVAVVGIPLAMLKPVNSRLPTVQLNPARRLLPIAIGAVGQSAAYA